jgi:hypothetical protein
MADLLACVIQKNCGLKELHLESSVLLDRRGLKNLGKALGKLRAMSVSIAPLDADLLIPALRASTSLEHISLRFDRRVRESASEDFFAGLSSCRSLTSLSLGSCSIADGGCEQSLIDWAHAGAIRRMEFKEVELGPSLIQGLAGAESRVETLLFEEMDDVFSQQDITFRTLLRALREPRNGPGRMLGMDCCIFSFFNLCALRDLVRDGALQGVKLGLQPDEIWISTNLGVAKACLAMRTASEVARLARRAAVRKLPKDLMRMVAELLELEHL